MGVLDFLNMGYDNKVLVQRGFCASEPSMTEVTEMKIYAKLRFSYDDLRDSHKQWEGLEGFLDGFENMDEAYDMGYVRD
ncbi:hypothetical protein Sjap_014616 [Stephania japonica]|uniref:Uncharacterized protein n=1 Tax=Stephania japonica TaxID=461633 RepID=A0AAP0IHL2_9MAGN